MTACFHCGEAIPAGRELAASVGGVPQAFCCHGCAAAAALIDGAGLSDYYRWRTVSGVKPAAGVADLWSAYDRAQSTPGVQRDGGVARVNLLIEGMRCSACGWLVEHRLRQLSGVSEVSLNPATARAHVVYGDIPLSFILRSIAMLGYQPHVLGAADTIEVATRERRTALKRLAVAGFGMMQVMMIAVALYEAPSAGMSPVIREYLRITALLVTTPVLLYAGAPFFAGALASLRARRLGMDVPVALGLVLAFAASSVNALRGVGEVYFDSVVMFLFLLLFGRYLEMIARHRAGSAAEALARVLPAITRRLTALGEEQVPVAALAAGDRIRVAAGEVIPADGRLVACDALVDESLTTGESRPVAKRDGAGVVGGTINLLRPVVVEVTATGPTTVLAGIARLLERASTERPRRTLLADQAAGWFVACVLVGAAVTATAWLWFDPARALTATLAVLVATCPCALSLATPVAVTAAITALARRGILVSRPDALEALARIDYALLDKTGTLTTGQVRVSREEVVGPADAAECRSLAAALEYASGHPYAVAFTGAALAVAADVRVITGAGVEGTVGGRRLRIGRAEFVAEIAGGRPAGLEADGVHLGESGRWLARFELEDQPRAAIHDSLERLRTAGIALEISSGDAVAAVERIAAVAGIDRWSARQAPADKLARVRALRLEGYRVAVVGDGANDAPGLGAADVSVAIGSGSALARADADLILVGGDLGAIGAAVAHARSARVVIRENLLWAAAYNLASLPLAALGFVPPWAAAVGMSASSLFVVANSLRLSRVRIEQPAPPVVALRPAAAIQ